jgi:hypothetical protein
MAAIAAEERSLEMTHGTVHGNERLHATAIATIADAGNGSEWNIFLA